MDINWILLDIINTGESIETASTTYQTWNDAIKAFYRGLADGSDDSALSHTFLIMDIFGNKKLIIASGLKTHWPHINNLRR